MNSYWAGLVMLALISSGHVIPSIVGHDVAPIPLAASATHPRLAKAASTPKDVSGLGSSLAEQVTFAAADMASDVMVALDGKYADKRPQKVHASFVLAMNGGHRLRATIKSLRPYLTAHEYELSREWVDNAATQYDALMNRRIAIMNCEQRNLIPSLIEYNDIAVQLLSKKINEEIVTQINEYRAGVRNAERRQKPNRDY